MTKLLDSFEKLRILVADDDSASIKVFNQFLSAANPNYEILSAPNGELATKIAKVKQPDLIIMDWTMPVMSGIDAIQILKGDPETAEIPIIMASGKESSHSLKIALVAGAIDYIRKPIDQIEFIARINSALELSRSYKKIRQQQRELESKNRRITASLKYASSMQSAILPSAKEIAMIGSEQFVFFRPRDIVSGDFYWTAQVNDKRFVVVADCTGHGVPGAFMSMIGNTLLDRIIKVEQIFSPDKILARLHAEIIKLLKQKKGANDDGMDIAICQLTNNEDTFLLKFSGAKRPLILSQKLKEGLSVVKGDRKGLGGAYKENTSFQLHKFVLYKDDAFYLTSDGYVDQNNAENKKLGTKRFMSLLGQCRHLSMGKQKELLEEWMDEHQRDTSQRDDMLILGVRL